VKKRLRVDYEAIQKTAPQPHLIRAIRRAWISDARVAGRKVSITVSIPELPARCLVSCTALIS
jgi:hypothetical protein